MSNGSEAMLRAAEKARKDVDAHLLRAKVYLDIVLERLKILEGCLEDTDRHLANVSKWIEEHGE